MQYLLGHFHKMISISESGDSVPRDRQIVWQNSWWILYLPLYFIPALSPQEHCLTVHALLFYRWLSLPSVNTVSAPGLWEFIREHLNHYSLAVPKGQAERNESIWWYAGAGGIISLCVNGRLASYQYILSRAEQGGGRWLSVFGVRQIGRQADNIYCGGGEQLHISMGWCSHLSLPCNKKLKLSSRCRWCRLMVQADGAAHMHNTIAFRQGSIHYLILTEHTCRSKERFLESGFKTRIERMWIWKE